MADLDLQIRESAAALKQAWTAVQSLVGADPLSRACSKHWTVRTEHHTVLESTADLVLLRQDAWMRVEALRDYCQTGAGDRVEMDGHRLSFNAARHFALVAYQSTTWSIYDRLANVCGRIGGCKGVDGNPRQNPKLCEGLLGKELLGFGAHDVLRQAYEWPARVSYKVRNWLVHEGYEEGTMRLFAGDTLQDGFSLHKDVRAYLEKCCKRADGCNDHLICIDPKDDCWPTQDLLEILAQYNVQIDLMFCSFVKWSVDALCNQIRDFASPHRIS